MMSSESLTEGKPRKYQSRATNISATKTQHCTKNRQRKYKNRFKRDIKAAERRSAQIMSKYWSGESYQESFRGCMK